MVRRSLDKLDQEVVNKTGDETIAGVKTFSSSPISSAEQSTAIDALTRKDYVDGLNTSNVKLTGNQTIDGVKTFSSTISGSISGNSDTATKLATARTISLTGDVSGSVPFDGSANVDIAVTVANDSHTHAFANVTGKPTTVSGYGITDVYTKTQTDSTISTAVAELVNGSPAALDTLNELAAALDNDPSFAATVSNQIGLKWTQDNTKISNWDMAYSWGNHANYGYASTVQVSSQLSQKADLSGAAFTGTVDVRAPLYLNPSLGTLTFASDTDNRIITQYQNGSTINWWQSLQASGDLQLYSPNNKKFVIYGSTATYVGINTSNPQSALDVNGTITATTYALSTNWKVNESGGVLFFEYNGVKKMKLDSSGNLTVTGDITAFGGV